MALQTQNNVLKGQVQQLQAELNAIKSTLQSPNGWTRQEVAYQVPPPAFSGNQPPITPTGYPTHHPSAGTDLFGMMGTNYPQAVSTMDDLFDSVPRNAFGLS